MNRQIAGRCGNVSTWSTAVQGENQLSVGMDANAGTVEEERKGTLLGRVADPGANLCVFKNVTAGQDETFADVNKASCGANT